MATTLLLFSSFIIASTALLGFCLAYQHWLKLDAAIAPVCAVSSLGLIQYISVLLGYLWLTTLTLQLFGIILLILLWYKSTPISINKQTSLWIYFIALTLFFLYDYGAPMKHGDALVFWGSVSKYIYLTQHLPDANAPFFHEHLTYTLGSGLWDYFFLIHTQKYSPGLAYTSHTALWLAPLLVVTYQKKMWDAVIAFTLAFVLLIICNNSFMLNPMADAPLSLYFFALLYISITETDRLRRYWSILPIILFFPLIKQIGFYFAGIVVCCLFVLLLIERHHKQLPRLKAVEFLPLLFIIVGLFFVYLSWSIHCQHLKFSLFVHDINKDSVHVMFTSNTADIIKLRHVFFKGLLLQNIGVIHLPLLGWFVAGILLIKFLSKNRSIIEKSKLLSVASIWFIGLLIYLVLLFLLETITFKLTLLNSSTITKNLMPSFPRYLMLYIEPFVLLLYTYSIKDKVLNKNKFACILAILTAFIFCALLAVDYGSYHRMIAEQKEVLASITTIQTQLNQPSIHTICMVKNKMISTDNKYQAYYIYELIPHKIVFLDTYSPTLSTECDLFLPPLETTK